MTTVERYVALGAVIVGAAVLVTVRQTSAAWAAIIFVGLVLFWLFGSVAVRALVHWRAEQGVRRDLATPWTAFSQPHPEDPSKWQVGIWRRTRDRMVLDHRVLQVLDVGDDAEVRVAVQDAAAAAKRWTENRVGM